jgi:predicted metalloendopeptidase
MRKDSINQNAVEKAYLIYAERGMQTLDYSHAPTDYQRGTVMEPESVGNIDGKFAELLPADVMSGGKFDDLASKAKDLNLAIDEMQNQMRVSRERGAFQQLQKQMKQMQKLVKDKEAIDAQMAVQDLGRAQMSAYNRTMDQESSYAERLENIGSRIAEIEAKMLEYAEKFEG